MKRLIGLLVVLAFIVGVAGTYSADAATKKVVKKAVKKAVKKKPAPKKAAPRKAAPAPAPAPVAPVPPPPVAPVAPRAPVVAKPAAPAGGIFGMGINSNLSGLYISTGKGRLSGAIGARADWVLDDPLALGTMVGLSASAVKYRVGLGGVYGGGIKAVPLFVDGVVTLPAEWVGGMNAYVGGGLNYTLYGSGNKMGKYGVELSAGLLVDLGLGLGKTGIELGYSAVRSNTVTAKGFTLSVSQPLVL